MDGRLEIANKDFESVNKLLDTTPDYVAAWVLDLRAKDRSAKTCNDYVRKIIRYLKSIDDDIKNIPVERLTKTTVKLYLVSCQTKENFNGEIAKCSKSYLNTVWSCLNNFFTFLENEELINKNPIDQNSRPGGNDLDRINEHRILLTKKDFKKILGSIKASCNCRDDRVFIKYRDYAIIHLFMCTGIRESALMSINLSDINFDNKSLFILDKGEVSHKFILTDACIDAINEWLPYRTNIMKTKSNNTSALFLSERGTRIGKTALTNSVTKYTKSALGYSVSPHKLRAGVCSILYKETKDIEFVRRFIGHSDVSVTQRYIVTGGDEIERGNKILNDILN